MLNQFPPSINHQYDYGTKIITDKRGRRRHIGQPYLTGKARAFKKYVEYKALEAKTNRGIEIIEKPLTAIIDYYFADLRKRDTTNWDKLILDGMQKIIFKNDNQIADNSKDNTLDHYFKTRKFYCKENPRIEIYLNWRE